MNLSPSRVSEATVRALSYVILGVLITTAVSQSAPATNVTKATISTHDLRIVDQKGKTRVEITTVGHQGTPAIILRDSEHTPIAILAGNPHSGPSLMLMNTASKQAIAIGFKDGSKKPVLLTFNGTKVENALGSSTGK